MEPLGEAALQHHQHDPQRPPESPAGSGSAGLPTGAPASPPTGPPTGPPTCLPADTDAPRRLDLSAVRERLAAQQGPAYWRSLDELAQTEQFQELVQREFPSLLPVGMEADFSRRRFLQLMGASFALAGLAACARQPLEKIVPYVKQPEEIIPGKPLYFATAVPAGGYAMGVLVESHLGRPTKVEGNPDHPASLGSTDLFAQASVLTLYDPDRSKTPTSLGEIRSWTTFLAELAGALTAQKGLQGAGLRLLTTTITSPTLAAQIRELLARYPKARWHQYEPAGRHGARVGARMAFGDWTDARYDFTRARVVVALDADFMCEGPAAVRYARDFMSTRRARVAGAAMSRLYCVESTPTSSGTVADHRLALAPAQLDGFVLALAAQLGVAGAAAPPDLPPPLSAKAAVIARDLAAHRGASVVVAGEHAPPELHALAHAMNAALGNLGATVLLTDAVEAQPEDQLDSLQRLVAEMAGGKIDLLVVLGGNPVYDAPVDLDFTTAMQKVPLRVHLGLHQNETSDYCHWHLPETHALESWSDARAFDGTVTIVQPLIEPLYDGRSAHGVLACLLERPDATDYDLVREHWRAQPRATADFESFWRKAVHDGVLAGTALLPRAAAVQSAGIAQAVARLSDSAALGAGLALIFRPDPTVHDGRHANNGWLQECPKPLTKLTWDNAALLSPATAQRLGVANEDLVELRSGERRLAVAVWVLPGQADGAITLHLGYGRTRAGRVGNGCGFNAYALRTAGAPWIAAGIAVTPLGRRYPLACTQEHHSMEGRELVRVGTLAQYQSNPDFARDADRAQENLSLYPGFKYEGHAWGLAIDLTACIGCNACVVACQAENNIPIVGKEQVHKGREMHWIRIDRYFEGGLDEASALHQPVMCMHCEQAPCEPVCPVAATSHSAEGLNDMTYNRCVGTRYCSNNCPYKVRRFNFLEYNDRRSETLKMQRNPDVTVRMRGLMEKCTYCVQRINVARINAKTQGRPIQDGEIVTACQQACPTQAIVFGDINDTQSEVTRWKATPLNYGLLTELGTRPRTTYLAKLRNPNPELEGG